MGKKHPAALIRHENAGANPASATNDMEAEPLPEPAEKPKRRPGRPRKSAEEKSVFKQREAKARAKLENGKGNVEKLLFRQIRAFEWAQEAWIRSMTRGNGAKQEYLTREDASQGMQLATMLEKLVETQGRYLKEQKAIGARLTEEQLIDAAVERIMGIEDTKKRRLVLRKMIDRHNGMNKPGGFSKMYSEAVKAVVEDVVATDAIADLLVDKPDE